METYNTTNNDTSTSTIISNILNKYNLKESEEELVKKFFGKEEGVDESNGLTIFWVATKLSDGIKPEKEALSILTERLHVNEKTAEQIMEDIKKNLLPIIRPEIKTNKLPKPPVTAPNPPGRQKQEEKKLTAAEEKPKRFRRENIILPKSKIEKNQEKPLKRQSKDIYREPIE